MIMTKTQWVRVSRSRPCEACGRDHFCTRSADGMRVKCTQVESSHPVHQKDGTTNWVHLVLDLGKPIKPEKNVQANTARLTFQQVQAILNQNATAISSRKLQITADGLGVRPESLKAYGVGYDNEHQAISAPMRDGKRRPIGVHLRYDFSRNGNNKGSLRGSRNGIFIPDDYAPMLIPEGVSDDPFPLMILTPEGLSDCCAARDAGFVAIGRPSNSAGLPMLIELFDGACKQHVMVVGEREKTKWRADGTPFWPGIEGALLIAEGLLRAKVCASVRYWLPPEGKGKDLREFLSQAKTPSAELLIAFYDSNVVTERWLANAKIRLEKRRLLEHKEPTVPAA